MGFKNSMQKIKRALLCCRKEKKRHIIKIGPTTDVRRMDITEGMPNLTEDDAKFIQEKASNDAYRLLSLQSHPPTQPTTPMGPPSDPFASSSALPTPTDPFASASPSAAASQTQLPAPSPSSAHSRSHLNPDRNPSSPTNTASPPHNTSPTALRTAPQKIWDKTRRLSGLSRRSSHRSYLGLEHHQQQQRSANKRDEPLIIELDARDSVDKKGDSSPFSKRGIDDEDEGDDSDDYEGGEDTRAGASVRGFEIVGTVGGTVTPVRVRGGEEKVVYPEGTPGKRGSPGKGVGMGKMVESPLIERAVNATEVGDSSDSEAEVERRPLVRA